MNWRITLAGVTALALASCNGVAGGPGPSGSAQASVANVRLPAGACFRTEDIERHVIANAHTLYLRTRDQKAYQAVMGSDCFASALSSDALVIRTYGASTVCRPHDLDVSRVGGTRCIAQSITMLTPAEVAAIPERLRP